MEFGSMGLIDILRGLIFAKFAKIKNEKIKNEIFLFFSLKRMFFIRGD